MELFGILRKLKVRISHMKGMIGQHGNQIQVIYGDFGGNKVILIFGFRRHLTTPVRDIAFQVIRWTFELMRQPRIIV